MNSCNICPHQCGVDRTLSKGFCQANDSIKINVAQLHYGEEPIISGSKGSGTIFFSHCNLKCIFCQNYLISQQGEGKNVTVNELAEIMLCLQDSEAHNINLVTPSHFSIRIAESLILAKNKGLKIPVVWNSNAYEKPETLRQLDGLVDVYLPDFKYFDEDVAERYSGIKHYRESALSAIREMFWQVGNIELEKNMANRGVMIRILNLPGDLNGLRDTLLLIKRNFGNEIWISLMFQYYPAYQAKKNNLINRGMNSEEQKKAVDVFNELGFYNGYIQDLTCSDDYTPDFKIF